MIHKIQLFFLSKFSGDSLFEQKKAGFLLLVIITVFTGICCGFFIHIYSTSDWKYLFIAGDGVSIIMLLAALAALKMRKYLIASSLCFGQVLVLVVIHNIIGDYFIAQTASHYRVLETVATLLFLFFLINLTALNLWQVRIFLLISILLVGIHILVTSIRFYGNHPGDNEIAHYLFYSILIFLGAFLCQYAIKVNDTAVKIISERASSLDSMNKKLEFMVTERTAEIELLLKEVHHRIKNNMNTVKSILYLQEKELNEQTAIYALQDASSRIQSMMVLYDRLYRSDEYMTVSIKDFLPFLVDEIVSNFPNSAKVTVVKEIEDAVIDSKKMQALGIIVNELITNSMKHAFADRYDGKMVIATKRMEDFVVISIEDNGDISNLVDFENSNSFGLKLVRILVGQINGELTVSRENGIKVIIIFPA
jgi:two-component sensor histidine kinase